MFQQLYEYLLVNKRLDLEGIGTLTVERNAAQSDFANKQLLPPTYTIHFQQGDAYLSNRFNHWLYEQGHSLKSSYDSFISRFKNELLAGEKIEWKGVGIFHAGLAGEIKFQSAVKDWTNENPVTADKIIRENASHTMLVGERERSSEEMVEYFNERDRTKNQWWIGALIAALLSLAVLVIHHLSSCDTGLQQNVKYETNPKTHRTL